MLLKRFGIFCLLVLGAARASFAAPSSETISAKGGPIRITAKFHASTQIEYGGKVIVIDPVRFGSWTKKADVILITHSHPDHFDLAAVNKLKQPKNATEIIVPESLGKQVEAIKDIYVLTMKPGEYNEISVKEGLPNIGVHAVRMYNTVRGPKPGQKFHPKEEKWCGYYLTIDGKRLYFAGDTEYMPEMKNLKDIYAAFLPMNLPFTMTPQEAAQAARAIKPKLVFPYHYRYPFDKDSGNERTFAKLLKGSGIRVEQLEYYPAAAVKKATAKP